VLRKLQTRLSLYDWDSSPILYCTFKAAERPMCGSVAMDECFSKGPITDSDKEWDSNFNAWSDWSEGKKVKETGTCDEYE
jgi:hypothetical protein